MAEKEPGTFSGAHFDDVMPIRNKGGALIAARLCNFQTSHAGLSMKHMDWLDKNVQPLVQKTPGLWIDLIGYASQLPYAANAGPGDNNYALSNRRVESVKKWISEYSEKINFQVQWGKGASESATILTNNDGWWRAVEVYVYGFRPAPPVVVPHSKHWKIRSVGSASYGASEYGVGGSLGGTWFQIVDKERREIADFVQGGVNFTIGIPGFPDFSFTDEGPWTDFETSEAVDLSDFQGSAALYQDPGVEVGSWSVGGTMRLAIDSDRLLGKGARITPHSILGITSGSGVSSPGLSIGIPGPFKMVGTSKPFSG